MQTEWRVACVRIPRFPIGAVQRAQGRGNPGKGDVQLLLMPTPQDLAPAATACSNTAEKHWDDQLLVLSDNAATRPRLRVVTAAAAREGIRAGMTLSEARALCGTLQVLPWDDVAVDAAITAKTGELVRASPQVSPALSAPGMWWVGASGFAPSSHTNPSGVSSERVFAQALLAIAKRCHPRARIAIADSCVAARAGTWGGGSFQRDDRSLVCIVPPGRDAAYLSSAPLALLPMDEEIREALRALGIRTIGALADLDAGDVEQRWGDEGLNAWRLAHGDDPRRPVLARADTQPHVEMELATPTATMEPVLFLVRPAVETLVAQLVSQGRSIVSLAVTLTLDDARGAMPNAQPHTVTREIRLPRPLARPAPLFERCRGLLSQWALTAPVSGVRLAVVLTSPLAGEQGNLLDTSWRDPGAADAALERVRAELGPGVVVKPAARDAFALERSGEWRDEAFSVLGSHAHPSSVCRPTRAAGAAENRPAARSAAAEHTLRLLESAERVDVDRDDTPRRIFWRGRAIPVTHAIGPERLSGDWWNDGYSRDYWRCESDEECGELVLYHDDSGWWVQGWYD